MPRPKGSKNRTRTEIEADKAARAIMPKRGRGRPKKVTVPERKPDNYTKSVQQQLNNTVIAEQNDAKKGKGKQKYTMTSKAIEKNRAIAAVTDAQTPEGIDFNAKLITHIMRIHEIASHADRSDLATLKSCFVAYLKLCQEDGFSVSNMAAYSAMGFYSVQHFDMFSKKDDPERKEFVGMVKSTCSMFRESLVQNNKLNPVIGIFWQRNFDGLRNDTEQIQNALEQDETYVNGTRAYKEKYKKLIGE